MHTNECTQMNVHNRMYTHTGRLLHHLQEIDTLSLSSVEYAVFDEADRLFEMGFAEQVCGCGCGCVRVHVCV